MLHIINFIATLLKNLLTLLRITVVITISINVLQNALKNCYKKSIGCLLESLDQLNEGKFLLILAMTFYALLVYSRLHQQFHLQ